MFEDRLGPRHAGCRSRGFGPDDRFGPHPHVSSPPKKSQIGPVKKASEARRGNRHRWNDSPTPATRSASWPASGKRALGDPQADCGLVASRRVLTFVATAALPKTQKGWHDPRRRNIIAVVTVDANGLAVKQLPGGGRRSSPSPSACPRPSAAAVDDDVCPVSRVRPITRSLRRHTGRCCASQFRGPRRFSISLPRHTAGSRRPRDSHTVHAALDDSTRCVLYHSGTSSEHQADGLVPAYGCGLDAWWFRVLIQCRPEPCASDGPAPRNH